MSDAPASNSSDGRQGTTAELPLQSAAGKGKAGKLPSDAALNRRFQKRLIALIASDVFRDFVGASGGFYFMLWPLLKDLRKSAQRYRNKPEVFFEVVDRLVRKVRLADPVYDRNCGQSLWFWGRLNGYFQEPNAAESLNPKLTKSQKRKKAEMLDMVESVFPLQGRVPSDKDGKRIAKILSELSKSDPGRPPDQNLQRAIALHEKGVRGYKNIARLLLPNASEKEIDRFKKSIADKVRYLRKRLLS
jgi:hypothetical protein